MQTSRLGLMPSRRLLLAVGASVLLTATVTMAQVRIPNLPRLPLPGIDAWLHGEPALTTSIADAVVDVPWLDQLETRFQNLDTLRNARGRFDVRPGHWSIDVQSFCLFPGRRGPSPADGHGYLWAPLKGSRAGIVHKLLDRYSQLNDIPQHEMQVLLWGVAAKAKMKQMPNRQQLLAARLLTPLELAAMEHDALGVIPPALRQRVYNTLPREVRAVAEAENNLRGLLAKTNPTYAELEAVAVLRGPEPPPERPVSRGRWSVHQGMLVRMVPSLYSRTTVQIAVPSRYQITRDALGRIVAIDFGDGTLTETEYDDAIAPFEPPGTSGVVAYAFKAIRLARRAANGNIERTTIDRDGWTFANRPARTAVQQFGFVRAGFRQASLDQFRAWQARYERWNTEYRERAEWYKQRWARNTNPPPDVQQVLRDLEDMDHYRAGIESVLTGGPAGQLNWLIEHQERMNAALERATLEIAGLGVMPDEFSPSDHMAVPAARGAQRLGLSARRF